MIFHSSVSLPEGTYIYPQSDPNLEIQKFQHDGVYFHVFLQNLLTCFHRKIGPQHPRHLMLGHLIGRRQAAAPVDFPHLRGPGDGNRPWTEELLVEGLQVEPPISPRHSSKKRDPTWTNQRDLKRKTTGSWKTHHVRFSGEMLLASLYKPIYRMI